MAEFGAEDYLQNLFWNATHCAGHKYYQKILSVEQPKFEGRRDLDRIFYPMSDVQNVLDDRALEDIISCECLGCKSFPIRKSCSNQSKRWYGSELDVDQVKKGITSKTEPRYIVLAILLCMGQSYLIRHLGGEYWDAKLPDPPEQLQGLLPHNITKEAFSQRFKELARRFPRRIFEPWTDSLQPEFSEDDILPFVSDRVCSDTSGYGTVYRFKIYDCYNKLLGEDGKPIPEFARKVLRTKKEENFLAERDSLAFVSRLKNPNIIKMFAWYTIRKADGNNEYTYVFPFMETNLESIIWEEASVPRHLRYQTCTTLLDSPIWKQMVDITAALVDIHNPDLAGEKALAQSQWIGYHFDLKPSNILVSGTGKFLISDFGHSLFRKREGNGTDYGLEIGSNGTDWTGFSLDYELRLGTEAYQPPELRRKRNEGLGGALESYNPEFRRRYDVWSLACVMTEVITFIIGYDKYTKSAAVKSFTMCRKSHSTEYRWYYIPKIGNKDQPALSPSVKDWFAYMRSKSGTDGYFQVVLDTLENMFNITTRIDAKSQTLWCDFAGF
ncbi:hypothetical protein ABW19_dt0208336 [Dactylella cylindrospora]|nr:hypothetical protein ABW19_dt0208336 [Dactylella cylindrospora]